MAFLRSPLSGRRALLLLSVAVSLLEAAAVRAAGPQGQVCLAAQAAAPPGWAVFHDLRWLAVYHRSWAGLAAEALGMVTVRATISAAMTRAAWPDRGSRPPWTRIWLRAAAFTALAYVMLAPFAAVSFAAGVVSLGWPLIAGTASALAVVAVSAHGGITAHWWRRFPPLASVAWALASFLVLTAASAAVAATPGWWALAAAAAAGVANAWLWRRTVAAALAPRAETSRLAPAALLAVPAALVVGGAWALGAVDHPEPAKGHPIPYPRRGAVLLIDGFDSSWNGTPSPSFGGLAGVRYSYEGLSPDGRPLPYASWRTHASLAHLVDLLSRQLNALHASTHRPVSIVAVSEGTVIARMYLSSHPGAPVSGVALLSPLVDPGRVAYPPANADGWGLGAGRLMDVLLRLTHDEHSRFVLRAETPFLRSLDSLQVRELGRSSGGHPRIMEFLPMTSALVDPPSTTTPFPSEVVPAVHAALLSRPAVRRVLGRFLDGRPTRSASVWGPIYQVVRYAAAGWQVPSLTLGLEQSR